MRSIIRRLSGAVLIACALCGALAGAALADNYVALGDSYSSGTGTRDYSLNSTCQRSPYAYPYLIKQDRAGTSLNFVACSGAKTADVMANQIGAVTSTTNIVTITIGGNDAGFSSDLTKCPEPLISCDGDITNPQHFINDPRPGRSTPADPAIESRPPHGR